MDKKTLKGYVSNEEYIWHTNKGACNKCESLNNTVYEQKKNVPQKPHPNCKCYVDKSIKVDKKDDIDYHEILKQAAIFAYHGENAEIPEGYNWTASVENKKDGFYADVLQGKKDIIIAYRGTNEFYSDIDDDIAMARANIPSQTTDALKTYNSIKNAFPDKDISLTGHSLGGSLADIVAGMNGEFATTFNAYGVKDILGNTTYNDENIINYINTEDAVTMVNGNNHIGTNYSIPNRGKWVKGKHDAEKMGNLAERKEITTKEIKDIADKKFKFQKKVREGLRKYADTIEKGEILRNKIKRRIEEMELQRNANQRLKELARF